MADNPPTGNAPNLQPPQTDRPIINQSQSAKASWIFGGLLLLFLIMVVFLVPNATGTQQGVIRFLMALTAALLAFFFVGGVLLHGTLRGLAISATGGFVLFVLIQFVFNPFSIKQGPNNLPPDSVSANLPSGLRLRDAITFLAEIDSFNADINENCDSIMELEVNGGPVRGKSTVELIELLPLRLKEPKPRSIYRVNKLQEKGIYEITCK